nr:LysE family transporter [Rubrobacter calidifluminis]
MPFVHGFVLALGLIVVLGPQNMFVLAQGATRSRLLGALPAVLTASLSDTTLILAAVLGVSVAVLSLPWVKIALAAGGVLFLLYLGWTNWRAGPVSDEALERGVGLSTRQQVLFALSVSLLNPGAILDTVGVIGTSSLAYHGTARVVFTFASITVSWLWFFFLALVGRLLGKTGATRGVLNRVSAVVMWASALYLGYELLFRP